MKQLTLFLLLFPLQSIGQSYFQQEVNYTIDVRLDDIKNELTGMEEFEYVNNSPDKLTKIFIHLWPNAYSTGHTALANQQYKQNDDKLRFGNDSLKGSIDSLNFRISGSPVIWTYDEDNPDICIIHLPIPLQPGERLSITTPFRVKIPSGVISRLGHIDQSYQITQWYPKPAVYDADGWHPLHYLNQGEFYSEYGSFDVRITLPDNYVVGATGDLQTKSEVDFMNNLAEETAAEYKLTPPNKKGGSNAFPTSSENFKTIRFTQRNVHDFAWFADKRYKVLKGSVELPHSGRKVNSWALFTPKNALLWQKAIEYINDGTYYYSKWNGDYPYNNVTAVDGTISAGGGMEYPNVTVIGRERSAMQLEIVIVHEVGHNWFYGQLGSNEREHGWMDEGMNTLNEMRYIQTKYPDNANFSKALFNGGLHFNNLDHHDSGDISYRTIAWLGEDQPIETSSPEFSPINYGIVMYQKTGLVFFYLKDYLGQKLFDECAMEYYRSWEFKHPSPVDMRASFEKTSGKDLSWLFDDLINTTKHIDYKIVNAKTMNTGRRVTIKNIGQIDGPIPVSLIQGDTIFRTVWIEPGQKKTTIDIEGSQTGKIVIDYYKNIPELNRQNNTITAKGLFKKVEPIKFEWLFGDNEQNKTNVFWTPIIGSNVYDKFMIGAAIHNYGLVPSKWNYFVAPTYSVGRQMVSGVAEFSCITQPKKAFKQSRIGLSIKSFKHDTTYRANESYFLTLSPYWQVQLGSRDKKAVNYKQYLLVQGLFRMDKFGTNQYNHAGGFIKYNFNWKKTDHTVNVQLRNDFIQSLTDVSQMGRLRLSAEYGLRYMRKNQERWVEIRGFYGNQYLRKYANISALPGQFSGYQYAMSLSGTDGQQDLFTENYFFGRNELTGMWSQQRAENMGGFRSTSYYGSTDRWMLTGNMWLQLPYLPKIFGAFADAGIFHNGTSTSTAVNLGVGMKLGDIFGLYFPLWMSKELNDSFGNSKYREKIRFTLNLNIANKSHRLSEIVN